MHRALRHAFIASNALAVVCFASCSAAAEVGVRHRLLAGLDMPSAPMPATIDVMLRIFVSSHSVQTDFARPLEIAFKGPLQDRQLPPRIIWDDAACHQRRGYPKITPLATTGRVSDNGTDVTIDARPRRIGVHVPQDELLTSPHTAVRDTRVDPSLWYYRTSRSGLIFRMSLQSDACVF